MMLVGMFVMALLVPSSQAAYRQQQQQNHEHHRLRRSIDWDRWLRNDLSSSDFYDDNLQTAAGGDGQVWKRSPDLEALDHEQFQGLGLRTGGNNGNKPWIFKWGRRR